MSRIYWDTSLFLHLLEGNPALVQRVQHLLDRSFQRGDSLFTSCLALAEIMTCAEKSPDPAKAAVIRQAIEEMGFSFLAFDNGAIAPFTQLRTKHGLSAADSTHLACAASAGIDLFLTADKQLTKLNVPGIHFIADFTAPIF